MFPEESPRKGIPISPSPRRCEPDAVVVASPMQPNSASIAMMPAGPQRPSVQKRQQQQKETERDQMNAQWNKRIEVTQALKQLPRPPQLVNHSIFFNDSYAKFVRERCVQHVTQAIKKVQMESSRYDAGGHDDLMGGGDFGGGDGFGELRGEDLKRFQTQWLVISVLVSFLRMRELAKQHAALQRLRAVLAPKIRIRNARKRRIAREQVVIDMFRSTMLTMNVSTMKSLPIFEQLDDETLASMESEWKPCCFIDEFIVDERTCSDDCDIFVLDQGFVEITKRQVPTLDVIAEMMATKRYKVTHGFGLGHRASRASVATTAMCSPDGDDTGNRSPFLAEASGGAAPSVSSPTVLHGVSEAFRKVSMKRSADESAVAAAAAEHNSTYVPPKTLSEALRDNYVVIGSVRSRGALLGVLSILEHEPTFVGYRAGGGKRCLLWRMPRKKLIDAIQRSPPSQYLELVRTLRVQQMVQALPPTPQALRNCDVNVVFRHWTDQALEELKHVLTPACFLPGEVLYDSSNPKGGSLQIIFIARGVVQLSFTSTHTAAALSADGLALTALNNQNGSDNGKIGHHRLQATTGHKPHAPPAKHGNMDASMSMSTFQSSPPSSPSAIPFTAKTTAVLQPSRDDPSPQDLITVTRTAAAGPWQCIGEAAALVVERRSVVATAASKVDAWWCTKEQFSSIVQSHPALLLDAIVGIRETRCQEIRQRGVGMLRSLLFGDPLLKSAPDRLIDELVKQAKPFWFPPHEFLCGKDASFLPSLLVILDGSAYVQRPSGSSFSSNGTNQLPEAVMEVLSAQLGPGTTLNTAAMILEQPWAHSYTVRTRTAVEGYEISLDAFHRACDNAFGRREDSQRAFIAKLREAAAAAIASSSHVPIVLPKWKQRSEMAKRIPTATIVASPASVSLSSIPTNNA